MKFATPYNVTRERSDMFRQRTPGESMTQKSDGKAADINFIVGRFKKTGTVPVTIRQAISGDFTDAPDFRTAVEKIRKANESFAELPAKIRKRFNNDPAEFVQFVGDKENLPEMRILGLATPEEMKETPPTPPTA